MSQKASRKTRAKAPPPKAPPPAGRGARAMPRRWLYGGAAAIAVLVAVVLVLASALGGGDEEAAPFSVEGGPTEQLLGGIPQSGVSLGSPDAPVLLVEFADMQCPFCQKWSSEVLPALLDEYVRPGDVRIAFRGLSFIGPDSEKALRAVLAAGLQNKALNVEHLLYEHQGGENDGWVTDELVRAVGAAVPGLDVDKMLDDMSSEAVDKEIETAAKEAQALGVDRTPSFFVVKEGGELQALPFEEYGPEPFRKALDELLGR